MTPSLILGFIWVIASTITAMLPMRRQMVPGVALLVGAPILLWFIAQDYGFWVCAITLFAARSMFRNPLIYFARRAVGKPVSLPAEMQPKAKPVQAEDGR